MRATGTGGSLRCADAFLAVAAMAGGAVAGVELLVLKRGATSVDLVCS